MNFKRTLNGIITRALIIKGRSDVRSMMRNVDDAAAANEKTLLRILRDNKNSEYGRRYGFADIHSIAEYQKRVPICTYADVEGYVDRIYRDDEKNVLTSYKVIGFSATSGSIGKPKIIPVTSKQLGIYTKYTITRMLALADKYSRKHTGRRIKSGHGIPLVEAHHGTSPAGLPDTNIVDIAARKYGRLYPYILDLPFGFFFNAEDVDGEYVAARFGLENRDALYIFSVFANRVESLLDYIENNQDMLLDDIEKGTINDYVYMNPGTRKALKKKMRPNPERADELRREFGKGFDSTIVSRIWPNMKFINMIATSPAYAPYVERINTRIEGIPIDYSIYGASEGMFAASYECGNPGQLMLLDSCFYEFIEQKDCEDDEGGDCSDGYSGDASADVSADESNILTIEQLEAGKKYEIIVTTQAGLYRYRFNDVIEVIGHIGTCPIVNFSYRKGQLVNVICEKTNLEQMNTAIDMLENKTGIKIENWAIRTTKGGAGGRYEIFCEGSPDVNFSEYSELMDDILSYVNTRYKEFRSYGVIAPAVLINQLPGTHSAWREKKIAQGASSSQLKPVTVLDTDEKRDFFTNRTRAE